MPKHPSSHPTHPSHHWGGWQPPLPEKTDQDLLETVLGNKDQARSVHRILSNCPPEVAAVGCLVLRLSQQIDSLQSQVESLEEKLADKES